MDDNCVRAYMRIHAILVKQHISVASDEEVAASGWKIPEQFHQAFLWIWLIACICHENPKSNDDE
jgi:hypothetical protein